MKKRYKSILINLTYNLSFYKTTGDLWNNYLQSLCQSIYSYSGFSIADTSQNVAPTGMILRGALTDYVEFIEVIIGSDRTGRMPARKLLASNGTFGLTKSDAPIYVVPLADMPCYVLSLRGVCE